MDIVYQKVNFAYSSIGTTQKHVLKQLNVSIPYGKITAIIGKTGSGKTTLTKLLNGLEKPNSGSVSFRDYTLTANSSQEDCFVLKKHVGMVFQFPETQLFERTVLDDVMFGPLNFGFSVKQAKQMALNALEQVGIHQDLLHQSPLQLSGGQMRRVAIAGVLACDVDVIVLDEPTAGLDSDAKIELMQLFTHLNTEYGKTIIFVSHDMNEVGEYADYVAVIHDGECVMMGDVSTIFYHPDHSKYGIVPPETVQIFQSLLLRASNSDRYTMLKPVKLSELIRCINVMKQEENSHYA